MSIKIESKFKYPQQTPITTISVSLFLSLSPHCSLFNMCSRMKINFTNNHKAANVVTSQAAATTIIMLPPSPSPSMGRFHRYHQQRPPSSSSLSSGSSCSISPHGGDVGAGATSGSDSSSCCSSIASIQTAITSSSVATAVPMEVDDSPQLFPMLPPPVPTAATGGHTKPTGAGSSLSLAGITRHMRITCSNHSSSSHNTGNSSSTSSGTATASSNATAATTNSTLFMSTIPLRRLRSSLRRHSVSGITEYYLELKIILHKDSLFACRVSTFLSEFFFTEEDPGAGKSDNPLILRIPRSDLRVNL